MRAARLLMTGLGAGLLVAAGFGLYRWGLHEGAGMAPQQAIANSATASTAATPATIDPSTWGIAEGEEATRRHMTQGLGQGDVDPVTGRRILYYHDPMVPGQKFEQPGKSPFMQMMLVPAYAGSEGADAGTVTISARMQQNLGLRTGVVTRGTLAQQVSAAGVVAWNEREQYAVQARAAGFVERLHVRAALDPVRKGQPLLALYVPDWVAAQEDYLQARRMQAQGLLALVDAAEQRMRQAGMDAEQIARVRSSGQVQARLSLHAPASGVVTELSVREGSTVLRIGALSTVWVDAEVPESQAARIGPGTRVEAHSPAWPGERFGGQVQALLPEVSPQTRTRRARMQIANPQARLVPGMSVQVQLTEPRGEPALLVPSEALVRTGQRTLVMRVDGEGFRPVQVRVGREQQGQAEILAGLEEGQAIVLSGQFLIDSEASLKGVQARLLPAEGREQAR